MSALRKNVASQHIGFVLTKAADGTAVTAGGAGTVVIDNGAQASCAGTFTHKGTGQWDYAPTQAETNGTSISFAFTGTGAIQVGMQLFTIGYDPTVANLPANLTQVNAHSVTDTTSGVPDVNVKNFGTTAVTGRDIGASVLLSAGTGTGQISLTTGAVTVGTNNDKTGYTASTVSDKTGYSLTQTFPTNFSALGISAGGHVSNVDTLTTYTGNTPQTGDAYATAVAIKAKTDNLPTSPAAVGSAMVLTSGERSSVADALLDRDMSTGADSGSTTVRTVRQALRFLRNKWAVSAGTLTVYKEDDSTSSWTSAVTTDGTALPIVSNDPAGP